MSTEKTKLKPEEKRGRGRPKGYVVPQETRDKIAKGHKGKKHSKKTRIKMSRSQKKVKHTWGDAISAAKIAANKPMTARGQSLVKAPPTELGKKLEEQRRQALLDGKTPKWMLSG